MPVGWQNAWNDYSFRFFSPEQVDQILREGTRRGREGSHAAIERILKHETGLQRADLWQRIRRLKNLGHQPHPLRAVWSAADEEIMREGYQAGWQGKREAVRQLLKLHPEWGPYVIWKHARKLALVQRITKRGQERSFQAWSDEDGRTLLDLAGYKTARVIAKMLHRSEVAIRYRLALLGKSSRVHREGFSRSALARELHLSTNAIRRLAVEGLLEVRDPRPTRESLDRLCRSGRLDALRQNGVQAAPHETQGSGREMARPAADSSATQNSAKGPDASGKLRRAKRVWAEVARSLNLSQEAVEKLIALGVLKLYDPRITEKSLRHFCRHHGSLINSDFLSRDTRDWLQSTMDFVPHSGEPIALSLTPLRKHARIVHHCKRCGRSIRGNVFFRHVKRCGRMKPESEARS